MESLQQSGAGVGGLVRPGWRQRGMGRLALLIGLLMFPLHVGAQGPGDLDPSFGVDGMVTTDFGDGTDEIARAIALQSDGKIVVAGTFDNFQSNEDFALARYLSSGALDPSFGSEGTVITDFGAEETVTALAIQPDGKIVVAGFSENSVSFSISDIALARYLPNGTLDSSFGGDGMVTTDFSAREVAHALVIQPNGKIVVAGSSANLSLFSHDMALVRYLPNGTLDSSFGINGMVTTDFGDGQAAALALARQPDGKLVAAGYTVGGHGMALARYLPNGTLDSSFGGDGMVTTDFGAREVAYALVIQPDSKIVVAGGGAIVNDNDVALARYRPNGSLDPSFDSDGMVTTDFVGGDDSASGLVLQPDGKIVVAGVAVDVSGNNDFALARYHPNGSLDETFSGGGKVRTEFSSGNDEAATALVMQPHDGRLVVAGGSFRPRGGFRLGFALARYHAIACGMTVATRVGTADQDTIVGTSGPDVIHGFGGNDLISGLGGKDILCGDKGKDTLRGGGGDDLLHGGPGRDTCNGGAGKGDQAEDCEQVINVP